MKHTFCMSDTHGSMKLFSQAIDYMRGIDEDFTCFFLGDAADRGRDGYKIMKMLLADPEHFKYIKGNHEDFFVKSARDILTDMHDLNILPKEYIEVLDAGRVSRAVDLHTCQQNGGMATIKSWLRDGAPVEIVNQVEALPLRMSWNMIDFCHAGCLREEWENNNADGMLWSRYHFAEKWFDDRLLIHGHTPVPSRWSKDGPILYADDTKFDIDMGTFYTHNLCVLELCPGESSDGDLSVTVKRFGKKYNKEAA